MTDMHLAYLELEFNSMICNISFNFGLFICVK